MEAQKCNSYFRTPKIDGKTTLFFYFHISYFDVSYFHVSYFHVSYFHVSVTMVVFEIYCILIVGGSVYCLPPIPVARDNNLGKWFVNKKAVIHFNTKDLKNKHRHFDKLIITWWRDVKTKSHGIINHAEIGNTETWK